MQNYIYINGLSQTLQDEIEFISYLIKYEQNITLQTF